MKSGKNLLEKNFKKKVKRDLDKIPNLYFFVKEALAIRGIPDIIGCYKGTFFAWELKKSRAEASKKSGRVVLQRYTIHCIKLAGGIGEIVFPDNFKQKLDELIHSQQNNQ